MAFITMAVYCTEENKKDQYLLQCLDALLWSQPQGFIDSNKIQLYVNAFTPTTVDIIRSFGGKLDRVVWGKENIGTARALNHLWKDIPADQHIIKMDDDIVLEPHAGDWVARLEEVVARDRKIGQVGLKRKDCIEDPWRTDGFRSELRMLPHEPGQTWIVVEKSNHVMGSCVLHSAELRKRVGYLWQPGLYGWDDVLMSHRAAAAGFETVFLNHIRIDHVDPGDTPFQAWKHKESGRDMALINQLIREYKSGQRSYYYGPNGEQ